MAKLLAQVQRGFFAGVAFEPLDTKEDAGSIAEPSAKANQRTNKMKLHKNVTDPRTKKSFKALKKAIKENYGTEITFKDSIYVNNKTKITVTCETHGSIEMFPSRLKNGSVCLQCFRDQRAPTAAAAKKELAAFGKRDGVKYTLKNKEKTTAHDRVIRKCEAHGTSETTINQVRQGDGCTGCGRDKNAKAKKEKAAAMVIEKFRAVHGEAYDYSEFKYVDNRTPGIIKCRTCQLKFKKAAGAHKEGQGCISCSEDGGFKHHKPAILYYLSVDSGTAYKIGITNRTVEQRFSNPELARIEVINTIHYRNGADAYKAEQSILRDFAYAKYTGDPLLVTGNTELFNHDILQLDTQA